MLENSQSRSNDGLDQEILSGEAEAQSEGQKNIAPTPQTHQEALSSVSPRKKSLLDDFLASQFASPKPVLITKAQPLPTHPESMKTPVSDPNSTDTAPTQVTQAHQKQSEQFHHAMLQSSAISMPSISGACVLEEGAVEMGICVTLCPSMTVGIPSQTAAKEIHTLPPPPCLSSTLISLNEYR